MQPFSFCCFARHTRRIFVLLFFTLLVTFVVKIVIHIANGWWNGIMVQRVATSFKIVFFCVREWREKMQGKNLFLKPMHRLNVRRTMEKLYFDRIKFHYGEQHASDKKTGDFYSLSSNIFTLAFAMLKIENLMPLNKTVFLDAAAAAGAKKKTCE